MILVQPTAKMTEDEFTRHIETRHAQETGEVWASLMGPCGDDDHEPNRAWWGRKHSYFHKWSEQDHYHLCRFYFGAG